jgi:hypothetical protein
MSPASHMRRSGPGEDGFVEWSGAGLEGNRDLGSETGVATGRSFRKRRPITCSSILAFWITCSLAIAVFRLNLPHLRRQMR